MPRSPSLTEQFGTAEDLLVRLYDLPAQFAQASHDLMMDWFHLGACLMAMHSFSEHPHEAKFQLEIPEPIADDEEQDLFA